MEEYLAESPIMDNKEEVSEKNEESDNEEVSEKHEESEKEPEPEPEPEIDTPCHDCGKECADDAYYYRPRYGVSHPYCEPCYRKHVPKCNDCDEDCEDDAWWVGGVSKEVYCEECWDYYEHKQCIPYLRDDHSHCDICEAHDHAKFFIIHTKDDGKPHCKICSSPLMIEKRK